MFIVFIAIIMTTNALRVVFLDLGGTSFNIATISLMCVLMSFGLLNSMPIFFPKFTRYQTYPWLSEDIIYIKESTLQLSVPMPDAEISRIMSNGQEIPKPPVGAERRLHLRADGEHQRKRSRISGRARSGTDSLSRVSS
jgi:hypothetical protein